MCRTLNWCLFAVCLLLTAPGVAGEQSEKAESETTLGVQQDESEGLSVTRHVLRIEGQPVEYIATAGTLPLRGNDGEGKITASVFFVAYTRDGLEDLSQRPITFCFNGGPGASSVWLHMGMLGPKRVRIGDDASPVPPPGEIQQNEHSLLDVTDLVFVDPVSTGYSRPVEGEQKSQFHGYREDLQSVGQFIHRYVTRYDRWLSPKFLLGESYGSVRAAGLAEHLRDRYYMELNGLVLISSALNFQTFDFGYSNDLYYVCYLPTYTATAWYHRKLPKDLQGDFQEAIDQSREFALGEYASALLRGSDLPEERRRVVSEQLARLTGLSAEYIRRSNLRVAAERFSKELLRDRGRTVGQFDSRYTGTDRDSAGSIAEFDGSEAALFGAFTACLYSYLRNDLKVVRDEPYEILTSNVQPWNFSEFTTRYVEAIEPLRKAMTRNPHLRVFAANGYYDMATPFLGIEYTLSHLSLPANLQDNVAVHYYPAGHMMYVHGPSLRKLRRDLVEFYGRSVAG